MSTYKLPLLALLLVIGSGCQNGNAPEPPQMAARRVADAYLESIDLDDPQRPVRVSDEGDEWLVTYDVPPGAIGGDVKVWVRKSDMTITRSVAGQ
jgi:hypothetical protein